MKKSSTKTSASNPFELRENEVRVDTNAIKKLMRKCGFTSVEKLAHAVETSRSTVWRALNKLNMDRELLKDIAVALGTSPKSICPTWSYEQASEGRLDITAPRHWDLVSIHTPRALAANGVSYCIVKLKHQILQEHFVRGKLYEMNLVPPTALDDLKELLKRHPTVCKRLTLAQATRVAHFCDLIPLLEDTGWWILDDWIEGVTLKSVIADESPLPWRTIKHIGTEILAGLDELHSNKVVFRELAPERIYLSNDRLRCTLTDFELAKILQDVPTVAGQWLTRNPYRAPELLEGKTIAWSNYARTDVYSWAAIVVEMFTGNPDAKLDALMEKLPDNKLAKFLIECRSPLSTDRPESVSKVLDVWNKWQAKQ